MNVAAGGVSAALWRRLRRCYSVLLMLAIWEGAARSGLVNSFLLPAASDVLANLWRMVTEGQLLYHAFESLMRASAGLGLALVIGIPLGLIRARSRLANSILDPILTFWFPVPKVGLIPIALLFFGLGHGSKIALVFVDALLPLVIATYQGALRIDDRSGRPAVWAIQTSKFSPVWYCPEHCRKSSQDSGLPSRYRCWSCFLPRW
jgi:ABC-type nitrate/sulfonate/bicarbonate transport system permease component